MSRASGNVRFVVPMAAFLFWTGNSLGQTIIHVPTDRPTIQAAIDAAGQLDVIVVAPGTYYETINFFGKAITLRSSGGADVTTINAAGLGGSVVTCVTGESPDTVLDGFLITGGTGTRLGNFTFGGGMFDYYSSPTVTNCTFSGNAATAGGGMYNFDHSNPTVTDCAFTGNTADGTGGGMQNSNNSSPTVTNCTFIGNMALQGGGMSNDESAPTVTNCTFSENTANAGGGVTNSGSGPTVTKCTFSENKANLGGGMYNSYGGLPRVTNCTFIGNTGQTYGGGIHNYQSSPAVTNCMFSGNTATAGGGIHSFISNATVTNCTFSGNTATTGGGVYNRESRPEMTNCIFWGDAPDEAVNTVLSATDFHFSAVQGGMPVGGIDGGGNIYEDPMFIRTPYPGPDGRWDGVDDDYGDLRLRDGSPCIDAGDPGFIAQPEETDLDGNPRVVGARVDIGAYEFESTCEGPDFDNDGTPDICDSDIDNDGVPNTLDACDFTAPDVPVDSDGRPEADLNHDCQVDLRDYAIFQFSFR